MPAISVASVAAHPDRRNRMPRCSAPRRSRTSRSHESADRDGDLEVRTRNLQIPRPDLQSFRCRAESCERRRQPLSGDMLRFVKLDQTREFACTARRKFRSDQWPAAIVDFLRLYLALPIRRESVACTARRKFRSGQLPFAGGHRGFFEARVKK